MSGSRPGLVFLPLSLLFLPHTNTIYIEQRQQQAAAACMSTTRRCWSGLALCPDDKPKILQYDIIYPVHYLIVVPGF